MRTFLALEVPPQLLDRIIEVQEKLKHTDAPIKFVEPDNLHFTVKFFGDVNPDQVEQIKNITTQKLQNVGSFTMHIRGTGVFPNINSARVLWLGVEDAEPFSNLQQNMDKEWDRMGFRKERSYIPHLTIGRVKGGQNKEILIQKIEELENVEIGPIRVEKLILKKSELTPVGPFYTDIAEFFLGD
jgi:2'-5' RNA ligase